MCIFPPLGHGFQYLQIKFYWNTALLIQVYSLYRFHSVATALSNCERIRCNNFTAFCFYLVFCKSLQSNYSSILNVMLITMPLHLIIYFLITVLSQRVKIKKEKLGLRVVLSRKSGGRILCYPIRGQIIVFIRQWHCNCAKLILYASILLD